MKRRDFGEVYERADRPGKIYVRFTWRGRRIKRYGGINRETAKRRLATLQGRLEGGMSLEDACAEVFGKGPKDRLTFNAAGPLFLQQREARVKPSTFEEDRIRLRALGRAPFASRFLSDLRTVDFVRFSESRIGNVSGPTVNRELALLSAVFKWAERMGFVKENPLRKVPRYSEKGREERVFLTAAEAVALIQSGSGFIRPALMAALHTGMRRGEILRLAWRDVNFDRREVIVRAANTKSGKGRSVPLTADLLAELARLKAARAVKAIDGSDPVFVDEGGRALTRVVIRTGLSAALRAEEAKAIPEEKRDGLTFHGLRHSAASIMAAQGVPLLDIARILGHSTLAVTMLYARFQPESGRAAADKLGAALALPVVPKPEAAGQ